MTRLLNFLILLVALIALVSAEDYRMDFKLKKGLTVAKFCKKWPAQCQKVAFEHHYRGTVNQVCERSPTKGVAQAYCTSEFHYETVQYTEEVGKDLGGTLM